MARSDAEGKGDANDAEVATAEDVEKLAADELSAKRREQADAAVEAAEAKVQRAEEHLAGAKDAVKEAKAHRASLKE